MKTIVFANQKGGTGKTTSVVNVGDALARSGKRVLVIDFDPQGHAAVSLNLDPEGCVANWLLHPIFNSSALSPEIVNQWVRTTHHENLYLLPGNQMTAKAQRMLAMEEKPINYIRDCVAPLRRMGFDTVAGWLEQGLHAWEVQGREFGRVPAVHAEELTRRIVRGEDFTLLDVRTPGEVAQGRLKGAQHIFLGDLPGRLAEVQDGRPVTTFCGSGQRAIIAASILKRAGFGRVEDALGSMAACRRVGCPME